MWKGGDVVSECGVIHLVNENSKEGSGLLVGIGLKLRVDLDYERRGDGREETGLVR